jgi:putative ABC transport system permease protein
MKTFDTIRRAGRSLKQAKARTLLTSLAIGVGAFTITLALAAGAGGRQYAQDLISANTDVHELRVTQKQTAFDSTKPQVYTSGEATQTVGNGIQIKQLSQADITKITKLDGVASVTPIYNLSAKYVTRADQKKYQVSLTTFEKSISQEYLAGSGANLSATNVFIPESYRDVLGFTSNQAAIGQTLDLVVTEGGTANGFTATPQTKTFTFTIAGVIKASPLSFATGGASLQLPVSAAETLYNYSTQNTPSYGLYMQATVQAKANVDTETVKNELTNLGYQAQTAQDLMSTIFQFINVLQAILIGFGVLAVLTSVFGIINTQYISVLERTQQIGLMKALGMRGREVGRLFKFEAAWIGFLGGVIGAGVAIGVGLLANPLITDALSLGKGTDLLIFQPLSVIAIIVGLMLVSVGSGILPARKAAKLDPIEALRTE